MLLEMVATAPALDRLTDPQPFDEAASHASLALTSVRYSRVSEVVQRLIPHDRLSMAFATPDGIRVHAISNDDGPNVTTVKIEAGCRPAGFSMVIHDLTRERGHTTDPADFAERWIAAGYRSLLVVTMAVRDDVLALNFWSKIAGRYSEADISVARRIAEHIALAVSHEQLADAARQIAEAHARAERLELRVKNLVNELDSRAGHGRVVANPPH